MYIHLWRLFLRLKLKYIRYLPDFLSLFVSAILDKIITQSIIAFRPRIPNGMERTLRTIIEQCWDDKPLNRPTMKVVDRLLKTIPGFQTDSNFVDSLLQRMSQYAEELESRIAVATAGMIEEKKKSEELLFQVLPR